MPEAITVVFYLVVLKYTVWQDLVNLTSGAHKDLTPDGQKPEIESLACAPKLQALIY